jgi:hypothetical protein
MLSILARRSKNKAFSRFFNYKKVDKEQNQNLEFNEGTEPTNDPDILTFTDEEMKLYLQTEVQDYKK